MNDVTIEKRKAEETIVTISATRLTELLQKYYSDLVPPNDFAESETRYVPVMRGTNAKEENMVALRVIVECKKQTIL